MQNNKKSHNKKYKRIAIGMILMLTIALVKFAPHDFFLHAWADKDEIAVTEEVETTTENLEEKIEETTQKEIETTKKKIEETTERETTTKKQDNSNSKLEALKEKAQNTIDDLPDASSKNFKITKNNKNSVSKALQNASNAIASYISAGGKEGELNLNKFNTLTKTWEKYEKSVSVQENGTTTVGELKEFMNTNFDDIKFRKAVLTEVLKYYGLNDSAADTDVITNTKKSQNRGPDNFASPEEVLGWVGKTTINVSDPGDLEGVQYISKLSYKVRKDQRTKIHVEDKLCINMQTFWGKSNNVDVNPDAIITATIDIDKEIVAWKQSNNSLVSGRNISLPHFMGDLNMGNDWYTVCDNLTYLRTNKQNKELIINSQLLRENRNPTTKEGRLENVTTNLNLIKTTDTAWTYQPIGKTIKNELHDQYYDEWEYYKAGVSNTYRKSPRYIYQVTANYYSSVTVDIKNELYGGFTFTKTSANDNNLNLSGAQYVVKMKDGEYLKEVGGNNRKAEFTTDITEAKIYETDQAGTFKVSPVPEGKYEVIEVKAPAGYKLNTTPVSVTVVADKTGIATSYDGAEGNSLKVNADKTTLNPHWEQGNYNEMTVEEDTTTVTLQDNGLFIRNASDDGNNITQMKYELLDRSGKYETIQNPVFTIKNLANTTVEDNLTDLDSVKDYINNKIIATDAMQSEEDSYNISASRELIYYDTTSVDKCVATQEDDPLPINLKLVAKKIYEGGDALKGGEFNFELKANENNPADDPLKDVGNVTNDAYGNIDIGTPAFSKPGTYKYTLTEIGDKSTIIYDKTPREIEIIIEEKSYGEGVTNGLTVTVKVDGSEIELKNNTSAGLNSSDYPHLGENGIISDDIKQIVAALPETVQLTTFLNRPVPKVSYELEKARITPATKSYAADANSGTDLNEAYGFMIGDRVEYSVTVRNTGELPLNMDITDQFADKEKFKDVKVVDVELTKDGLPVSVIKNDLSLSEGAGCNVTIPVGCVAVVKFQATVNTSDVLVDGAANRDWTAKDNEGAKGYVNTATADNIKATYTYKDVFGNDHQLTYTKDGSGDTTKYPDTVDGNGDPVLDNDGNPVNSMDKKEDVANTPVRPKVKSLSGIPWIDSNRDGQRSDDEEIIKGITITLLKKNKDGTYSPVESKDGSTISVKNSDKNGKVTFVYVDENGTSWEIEGITKEDGSYEFKNLPSGDWGIRFGQENSSELNKYFGTDKNIGDDSSDSDTDPNYRQNGVLDTTEEIGINIPEDKDIAGDTYESPHHDTGLYLPSLEVSKTVTGNMGDKDREFKFVLTLTSPEDGIVPDALKYVKGNDVGTLDYEVKKDNNVTRYVYTFSLAHKDSISFSNVPPGFSYKLEEIDVDDYTIKCDNLDGRITADNSDIKVSVTNDKNVSVPTLASMNTKIPVIGGLVAIVGIVFTLIMRFRRKRAE